ncbi:UNVERIFIED_CONTAM: Transcription factor, partial [Sesamum angustifolium]
WSLIAGRLPGRTGNDVKNFWNGHIEKTGRAKVEKIITRSNILRPQPRIPSNLKVLMKITKQYPSSEADECISWWKNLLETTNMENVVVDDVERQTGETSGALHDRYNAILEGDGDEFSDLNIDVDFGERMRFDDEW